MTVLDKRKPKRLVPRVVVMHVRANAQADPANAWVIVVSLAWASVTVSPVVILPSVQIAARVWEMPLSVLSAKPLSALKCLCASWQPKPMVKP
jgi:hypothetical protein